jgi:membrane carboxypeptidase/penicillin-binding protein
LGNKETGARAALPIWMSFMATALPREKSSRDFLSIPDETSSELAGQANDVPPAFPRRKDSGQKVASEPARASARPANKASLDQSNAALQESERQ